jgi:thioredoxin reductase
MSAPPAWSGRRHNLPNEDDLLRRGLYYGAGASEAPLCGGEDVYVVGGGNSAGQAVMHLAKHARSVTMLVRDNTLAASMSQYLSERILGAANVQVQYDAEIRRPLSASESARARQRKPTGQRHHGCSSPSAVCPTPIGPLTPPSSAIRAVISSPVPIS